MDLLGRARECALLDGLIRDIRRGESRSLVLRGEAGIGKTALLDYLIAAASDLMVVRAVGVESEMELAYAGLHQLCGPLLSRLESLPGPQRQALEIVFGLRAGAAPDRFLVALAVLSLLSEVSEERPLLCVVDDAQWLDQSSALTLAFVARRLLAEPVGLVFAAREPGDQLRHLPDLDVGSLRDGHARTLLSSAVRFRLDEQVRDRIVAETRGNPPALSVYSRILGELVEAAARCGRAEVAADAVRRLGEMARACGTDWILGVEARARALVADPRDADELYREAIERLGRTRIRSELARAQLLYGEWLRREGRRVDACIKLRAAYDEFTSIAMEAFTERARVELAAAGEKVRKRTAETRDDLTAQERQIAELARDGLSNPEIGARLFLSRRTVQYHLGKIFGKLGIRSRNELASALAHSGSKLARA